MFKSVYFFQFLRCMDSIVLRRSEFSYVKLLDIELDMYVKLLDIELGMKVLVQQIKFQRCAAKWDPFEIINN